MGVGSERCSTFSHMTSTAIIDVGYAREAPEKAEARKVLPNPMSLNP